MTNPRYQFIVATVKRAGELLLAASRRAFTVFSKGDDLRNLVTEVDLEINDFLVRQINQAYPSDLIFSEETENTATATGNFWTLDPIDGTSNFVRHIPHFAICLTWLENSEAVMGAVYNPVTNELFSFLKERGALLNGQKISVSNVTTLKEAYVMLHIGRAVTAEEWGLGLQRVLLRSAKKTLNLGSSALDLCFLGAGRVDAVIYGTLTTSDIAAAIGLLRAAGGEIYTLGGKPAPLAREPQQIIASSNRELFEVISRI